MSGPPQPNIHVLNGEEKTKTFKIKKRRRTKKNLDGVRFMNAEQMRQRRSLQGDLESQLRREANATAMRVKRTEESCQRKQLRRETNTAAMRLRRSRETDEEAQLRREANTNAMHIRRSQQTEEEKRLYRDANAAAMRERRFQQQNDGQGPANKASPPDESADDDYSNKNEKLHHPESGVGHSLKNNHNRQASASPQFDLEPPDSLHSRPLAPFVMMTAPQQKKPVSCRQGSTSPQVDSEPPDSLHRPISSRPLAPFMMIAAPQQEDSWMEKSRRKKIKRGRVGLRKGEQLNQEERWMERGKKSKRERATWRSWEQK